LPKFYMCPADRAKMKPVRWKSYECDVKYRKEKVACNGKTEPYKGEYPDDLDGRKHGQGSCLEFLTHDIEVMEEWESSWNEVVLRASFVPGDLLVTDEMSDVLEEVEIGYRIVEREDYRKRADRYYYPLMRVPIFYAGSDLPKTGVATRTFLGLEVDHLENIKGRYWFTYGNMQVPVLNATIPKNHIDARMMRHDGSDSIVSGVVHVILTIEDFEKFGTEAVPFSISFMRTLGEIAGFGALVAWATLRCGPPRLANEEDGSSRLIVYSKVDSDEQDDPHHGQDSDLEGPERHTLINRDGQE